MLVKYLVCQRNVRSVLLSLLVVACDSSRDAGRELDAGFDAYVRQTLDDWGAPGVMIVVVEGNQTVYMKGHGSRVLGEDRPIDEATIIQIASHTKPVTATAVAMPSRRRTSCSKSSRTLIWWSARITTSSCRR